jgi:2-deoxystreptamine N-acetyl-D-glucosaminyltransferase/2-deoxystreptamine glucosyltransferase
MSEEYACPLPRIQFIPLGADTDIFRPDEEARKRVRATLGVHSSQPVVLYSGKIAAHKRIDVLVRATAEVGGPPVVLVVVGDAEPATLRDLSELADQLGVAVRFVSAVMPSELGGYFNAADVCAWPADCTVSHLEAASCGRPIIIPDEPGIEDRVAAGNGLRVPVGDVHALASAIERLLGDADLRSDMGRRGRLVAETEYSWRVVSRRFEDLYESMLRRTD